MKEIYAGKEQVIMRATRQRKDGRYETRVQLGYGKDGKEAVKSFYATTAKESKKKAIEFVNEYNINNGKLSDIPFPNAIKRWLFETKHGSKKGTAFDRDEQVLNYQILPHAPKKQLKDVTTSDLQKILNKLSEKYSLSTLKKVKSLLKMFFEYAVNSRLIIYNPVPMLIIKKSDLYTAPVNPLEKDKEKIFSEEEMEKLKAAAKEKSPKTEYQNLFFIVMLNTGLRAGEALALDYADIDFKNKTINIHKNYVNHKKRDENGMAIGRISELTTTKTRASTCLLPINKTALETLILMKSYEPEGYTGPIIHNSEFERIAPRSFAKRFYSLLKSAGIKKCGLHTLRHTCGSIMYEAKNHNQLFVSNYLRHSSLASTNAYIHLNKINIEDLPEI